MKKKAFILFLKYPEKGMVKTRIAKVLGNDFTLLLYKQFVADILETSNKIDADTFIIYSTNDTAKGEDYFLGKGYSCLPQKGVNLGMRMYNAFHEIFSQGYMKLVLIGSDTPDLPPNYIDEAFLKLDEYDIVLGPSGDGGYYLMALQYDTLSYAIFDDIQWSTSQVLRKTLKNMQRNGMTCYLLPELDDIDDIDGLSHFYTRHKKRGETSHTMKFLFSNKEMLKRKICV
ncbi:MAG: TIGR04282 family arsenosugar biosynthesis glycosyltransferase [Thermodesulfobacteriota bacterium]|nr:TIGR04282 family arsenosugar biosynthesis glycosyltransferase [Thermodesulfobacteriota bacterium]